MLGPHIVVKVSTEILAGKNKLKINNKHIVNFVRSCKSIRRSIGNVNHCLLDGADSSLAKQKKMVFVSKSI